MFAKNSNTVKIFSKTQSLNNQECCIFSRPPKKLKLLTEVFSTLGTPDATEILPINFVYCVLTQERLFTAT